MRPSLRTTGQISTKVVPTSRMKLIRPKKRRKKMIPRAISRRGPRAVLRPMKPSSSRIGMIKLKNGMIKNMIKSAANQR
jgi:hypothetical protein